MRWVDCLLLSVVVCRWWLAADRCLGLLLVASGGLWVVGHERWFVVGGESRFSACQCGWVLLGVDGELLVATFYSS